VNNVSILSFVKCPYYRDIYLELFFLSYSFLFSPSLSAHCSCRGSPLHLITLSDIHTNTHTHGRIPLHEGSARRRDSYLTTHNNQKRAKLLAGFRTRNSSKRAAADPRLRRCGQLDRLKLLYESSNNNLYIFYNSSCNKQSIICIMKRNNSFRCFELR
jgi:hypothetical protein